MLIEEKKCVQKLSAVHCFSELSHSQPVQKMEV